MLITDIANDTGGRETTGRFALALPSPSNERIARSRASSLRAQVLQEVDFARQRVLAHQRARLISSRY